MIKGKSFEQKSIKSRFLTQKNRNLLFCLAVLAIPLLQVVLMYVVVNFNSIILAFKSYSYTGSGELIEAWAGFENFKEFARSIFLEGGALYKALKNTLVAAVVSIIIGISLSLLFSFYIYKKKAGYQIFNVLLFVPSIVSSIVMVIVFSYFVDRALPSLFLNVFGVKMEGWLSSSDYSDIFRTILFYNVWISFGSGVLIYSSSMSRIPPQIVEAAEIDGCGAFKEFFLITLPLIYPTISTFLVTSIAGVFSNQLSLYSFYSGQANPELWTTGYWLFKQTMEGSLSATTLPVTAAGGLIFTLIVAPLTLLVRFILDRFDPQVEF